MAQAIEQPDRQQHGVHAVRFRDRTVMLLRQRDGVGPEIEDEAAVEPTAGLERTLDRREGIAERRGHGEDRRHRLHVGDQAGAREKLAHRRIGARLGQLGNQGLCPARRRFLGVPGEIVEPDRRAGLIERGQTLLEGRQLGPGDPAYRPPPRRDRRPRDAPEQARFVLAVGQERVENGADQPAQGRHARRLRLLEMRSQRRQHDVGRQRLLAAEPLHFNRMRKRQRLLAGEIPERVGEPCVIAHGAWLIASAEGVVNNILPRTAPAYNGGTRNGRRR